jgi:outer membrane protein TolC
MSSVVRIVKRKDRKGANSSLRAEDLPPASTGTSSVATTVKNWITATRERRRAEADFAAQFKRAFETKNVSPSARLLPGEPTASKRMPGGVKNYRTILPILGLIFLLAQAAVHAQGNVPGPGESLTLDQAIALALRNNHGMKIAGLAVERADEDVSAAKTFRLPAFHYHQLISANLAHNEIRVPNPIASQDPGLGPFFSLTSERKPTALFAATVSQPLTQQYRIGLQIKLERLSRDVAQARLQEQQNETIDKVKKTYYAILQTSSALSSVEEAVKSYRELDKVTGDYVVQQVALKADHLVVQTRLAQVEYEKLELSNKLATQKEQLNSLLGRDVGTVFEVSGVPEFTAFETDLSTARQIALKSRPELRQSRLSVEQAVLDRRIKKSEYIPDVSAGAVLLTRRNSDAPVPRNFVNVGVVVNWEIFDWGRKKHQLAEKDQAIEQARNGLKETEDQVLIEVGDKLRKVRLSGEALRVAKLAENSAKENLRVSAGRYKFQAVMLSDVLQSQASLAEATNGYQRALLTFWTAKAEFEKALGEEK